MARGDGRQRSRCGPTAASSSSLVLLLLLTLFGAPFRCGTSVPVDGGTTSVTRTSPLTTSTPRPPPPTTPQPTPSTVTRTPPPPSSSSATMPWNDKKAVRVDVCALNACEAYVRMRDDLANAVRPINEKLRGDGVGGGGGGGGVTGDKSAVLEARLQRLDRRLRSVEQPGECKWLARVHASIGLSSIGLSSIG